MKKFPLLHNFKTKENQSYILYQIGHSSNYHNLIMFAELQLYWKYYFFLVVGILFAV